MPIAIIDYGAGNLRSVNKALEKLKIPSIITSNKLEIENSSGIILPGVGAFDSAMNELKSKKIISTILEQINKNKPFLGLCLGMQLLLKKARKVISLDLA